VTLANHPHACTAVADAYYPGERTRMVTVCCSAHGITGVIPSPPPILTLYDVWMQAACFCEDGQGRPGWKACE
jgi:hypothetical protein